MLMRPDNKKIQDMISLSSRHHLGQESSRRPRITRESIEEQYNEDNNFQLLPILPIPEDAEITREHIHKVKPKKKLNKYKFIGKNK